MKSDGRTFDAVAEPGDIVEVRVQVQAFGKDVLYVDVNGQTVARIGHIEPGTIHVELERDDFCLNRRSRDGQSFVASRRQRNFVNRS